MKCPAGTVEVSLWTNNLEGEPHSDTEFKSLYFDAVKNNTSGMDIIEGYHHDSPLREKRDLLDEVLAKLKPVLDLMEPRRDLTDVSRAYTFTPEEFEVLTEGIERVNNYEHDADDA